MTAMQQSAYGLLYSPQVSSGVLSFFTNMLLSGHDLYRKTLECAEVNPYAGVLLECCLSLA